MKNTLLYVLTVLIWGSTWIAIEFQLGDVAIEASLIYRFLIAAILILIFCRLFGLSLKFTFKQHLFIALLGILNFCLNYLMLYQAQEHLSSAMTSVVFSMLLLMNIVNTRIFFGKKITLKTYLGAAIGVAGIAVLFWPEISQQTSAQVTWSGIFYVLAGIIFASLGNMLSVRNSNHHYPVLQSSGWGMLYGTVGLTLVAFFNQVEFTISTQPSYLISLLYLSVFGTVIAFYSYFVLLKNIGPDKASYSIVLFPIVAVILSTLFEGFTWTIFTFIGFLFVATGNLLVLIPAQKVKQFFASLNPEPIVTENLCTLEDNKKIKQPS
ncbi:DMT family transporter [Aliikangiella maris]|uniref:EamA family transporter n=2 Tax=Aliikangiella maris TaxID=3162458 RepID=A0ABV3MJC3_9GAMM